ncbi:ABC transporter ATP-binding protein [Kocuria rosea]|jgi:ATP-binding cassette subfamily B multidrug efflux pump|uniref:ABC transporter ATP-binding protein n=1 Tax=Kocuria rosea TaxID=1275 RepID=UPI000D65036D|nr:ABC transporter ATP-binding protein [Kocuria rosea]MCM3484867.1 ABC transporter ATP-binding protein/permease [Kocuria rosea]MEB2528038.1 ABC transporter ATP-binding protein [Kocuria rosea]MEB2620202.1 ABC transporter ATP-binding protein [Kocuria rosea]PWF85522.1 multidrug ABC transporter ATP-binding protein [Kocuria rosea]PWF88966.1 multidrug ABC transporter ATP-binding protein [Kocuria rosea]
MLLRLVRQHTGRYLPWVLAVVALQLVATIAALLLPSLNARIIDEGVVRGDTGLILRVGEVMLGVALLQVAAAVAAVYCAARAAMGTGRDLRRAVHRQVGSFGSREVNGFGAPTLITRGTNDVQQIQMLVLMGLNFMVAAPIMCAGGIVMALREDAGLSWLVWVSVPVLGIAVGVLVGLLMPLFRLMQGRIDRINAVLREQIVGIRVVRAFVREDHERRRFAAANRELTDVSVRIGSLFVLMFPVITMILHLATAAVLWFGGQRVGAGQIQVGSLTAFLQYLLQILTAVMMGTFMVMMVPRAMVCAERITEVLRTEPSLREPAAPVVPASRTGAVELRDVTFRYPGAELPVLEGVGFRAGPGRTTAVVGATGSGKSTLLHLVPRLLDPTGGTVELDGVPLPRLSHEQIAARVALVPQRPYLFSGTVASNLRLGDAGATDEELWTALRTAQAEDFVRRMPGGLEAPIAQGGVNVSGGQRQRLCIARALVARPVVYLFDDSFSALDVATDARLRAALVPATRDATVLVVAQRVSTVRDADQILVLDAGRITARGTHDELLASSGTYREIVESQTRAEEVA